MINDIEKIGRSPAFNGVVYALSNTVVLCNFRKHFFLDFCPSFGYIIIIINLKQ